MKKTISRREFLRGFGLLGAGLVLAKVNVQPAVSKKQVKVSGIDSFRAKWEKILEKNGSPFHPNCRCVSLDDLGIQEGGFLVPSGYQEQLEAVLDCEDYAFLRGTDAGQPLGIINEGRVIQGEAEKLTINAKRISRNDFRPVKL